MVNSSYHDGFTITIAYGKIIISQYVYHDENYVLTINKFLTLAKAELYTNKLNETVDPRPSGCVFGVQLDSLK